MSYHRHTVTFWLTTMLLTLVAACGGSGSSASPAEALAAAKTQFDQAPAVELTITTDASVSDGDALLGAEGLLTDQPGFAGEVSVGFMGTVIKVPVIALDDTVWAKTPLSSSYSTVNLADFDAPNPVDFFDPDTGISSLLAALEEVTVGDQVRAGKLILTQYHGTIPTAAVAKILPFDSTADGYTTTVGLTDEHQLTELAITGDFFNSGKELTYTIGFTYPETYEPIVAP